MYRVHTRNEIFHLFFAKIYLEVDSSLCLRLRLVCVVDEAPPLSVEHEPPPVPHLSAVQAARAAHLVQVAAAGARVEHQVRAGVHLVAGRLDVLAQVEVGAGGVADGKVPGQRPLLQKVF